MLAANRVILLCRLHNTVADSPLQNSLAALRRLGVSPAVAGCLAEKLQKTATELQASVVSEIEAFTESGNPDVLPQLQSHIDDHLAEIHRLLGGARVAQLDFVRRHAARLADQRFPLEAMLHAYRVGLRVIGQWLRVATVETMESSNDTVTAVTDFTIEYVNRVSTVATSEYVRRTRELSEREADRRSQLLSLLLEGYDESDGRVTKLLRDAGYLDQRQSFCIVLARSVDAREMHIPARANRLLVACRKTLGDAQLRTLLGFHEHRVVAIVSATRRLSGWTVPQTMLCGRLSESMLSLGNSILVGVSSDMASTAAIPKALREAEQALEVASPGQRVLSYSEIPLRKLLLHAARGKPRTALPEWAELLKRADDHSNGKLISTLRAYADSDMNVLRTAKSLNLHANTVYARMEKVRKLTLQEPLTFRGLDELLLAVDWMSGDS